MKKIKLTYAQLSLMAWMMENPDGRYVFHTQDISNEQKDLMFRELTTDDDGLKTRLRIIKTTYPLLEGDQSPVRLTTFLNSPLKINLTPATSNGLVDMITGYDLHDPAISTSFKAALLDPGAPVNFKMSDCYYRMSAAGREWWSTKGSAIYLHAMTERFTAEKRVSRLILIGASQIINAPVPEDLSAAMLGFRLPLTSTRMRRPYAVASVTKETESDFRIERIQYLQYSLVDGNFPVSLDPIRERAGYTYVLKDMVLADDVTMEAVDRLIAVDGEIYHDIVERHRRAMEEIAPLLLRINSVRTQQMAMHDEMMSNALKLASGSGSQNDEPEPEDLPTPKQ